MFKKIICFILLALLLTSAFIACGDDKDDQSENGDNGNTETDGGNEGEPEVPNDNPQGLDFQLKEDGTYLVEVGKATKLSKIEIPATYKDTPVTELGKFAVTSSSGTSNTVLKEIVIPNTVTVIKENAFTGCTALKSVYITDLTVWCGITFENYSSNPMYYANELYVNGELITNLVIPDDVTTIGANAFYNCKSFESIVISDNVTDIGSYVFYGCTEVKNVEIGTGLTNLGEHAFASCTALTKVNVKDLAKWCGINFANNAASPLLYANKLYVNDELLSSLVIPESVVFVNARAFYNCKSLISVTLHSGVQGIGDNAFLNCDKMLEVINHSSLALTPGDTANGNISAYAKMVHSGKTQVENIDNYLFFKDNGVNYLITYIGEEAEITLPESYKGENYAIFKNAFYYYKHLTSVYIPDSVTEICTNAFYNCKNLKTVRMSNNVTTLGDYAFGYCNSLESAIIPNSVTTLGGYAFASCTSMTRLDFGNGVTTVGEKAFVNCSKLTGVYITDFEKWCKLSFTTNDSNPLTGGKNLYVNGELLTTAVIPESITDIGNYAFFNCTSLTGIVLHDGVTNIGEYAFYNCLNAISVTLGKSVDKIGTSAFDCCYRLAEIINHSSLKIAAGSEDNGKIGAYAIGIHDGETRVAIIDDYLFYIGETSASLLGYRGNATELVLPENCNGKLYNIHDQAFIYCDKLESIQFSNGVTAIGNNAFIGCSALTNLNLSASITSIGTDAFMGCKLKYVNVADIAAWCGVTIKNEAANPIGITRKLYVNGNLVNNLVIPEGVTQINKYVFSTCNSITSVTLPTSLQTIGSYAFNYCYKLVEVINHSSLTLTPGGYDNGYVSKYAKEIHTGESKIAKVGDYIFYSFKGVNYLLDYIGSETDLVFPESYNGENYEIYEHSFMYYNITSIVLPDSVTAIGTNAFRFCADLKSIEFGTGLTTIGKGVFYTNTSLESVIFKNTTGWSAGKNEISSSKLSKPATAAELLKTTYESSVWKRS